MSLKIKRGYSYIRQDVTKKAKYLANCLNCRFYYQDADDSDDDEELCNNLNVTEFDVMIVHDRIYCSYWKAPENKKGEVNTDE